MLYLELFDIASHACGLRQEGHPVVKMLLQYSSLTPLERERCGGGVVQPYRKTDYNPIIYIYEAYQEQYRCNPLGDRTIDAGNKLIELMKEWKKETWEEMITSIDLTHNSRKAWKTMKASLTIQQRLYV